MPSPQRWWSARSSADLSALTSLARSSLTLVDGGTAQVDAVSNIDGASLLVYDGVTLSLPAATSYNHASTGNSQVRTLRAEGAGSVLSLPNVTSITSGSHYGSELDIQALWGGQILLGHVTEIAEPSDGDLRQRAIDILAQGAGQPNRPGIPRLLFRPRGYSSSGDSRGPPCARSRGARSRPRNCSTSRASTSRSMAPTCRPPSSWRRSPVEDWTSAGRTPSSRC